jgi:mRNA interferase RelE/StbE
VYHVTTTGAAEQMFRRIGSASTLKKIRDKIDLLKSSPLRGKPLTKELAGYRSMPASGRYRVVFRVSETPVVVKNVRYDGTVFVCAIGIRRDGSKSDVYAVATALANRGQLG